MEQFALPAWMASMRAHLIPHVEAMKAKGAALREVIRVIDEAHADPRPLSAKGALLAISGDMLTQMNREGWPTVRTVQRHLREIRAQKINPVRKSFGMSQNTEGGSLQCRRTG